MDIYSFDDEIKKELQKAVNIVLKYKEDVEINGSDSRILISIDWLLEMQKYSGAWGNDNVAYTSMAMLALNDLNNTFSPWQKSQKIINATANGEKFLKQQFLTNSFDNAIWDTSLATRALIKCGKDSRNFISDRIKWLLQQNTQSLSVGPHHIAQMVMTFVAGGIHKSEILERCDILVNSIEKGGYNYSPYVLSQCFLAANPFMGNSLIMKKLEDRLVKFVSTTHLDSANFINICSTLEALTTVTYIELQNKLKITTASLFGESCFRDNGTWYSDELNTSWALIVLTNYSKEVVIKAPKSEIIYDLNNSISLVHKLINNQRSQLHRKWLQHYCIVFLCGVMAAYFVTYTTISSNMVEWIKWGVPTVFMLLSGYTIRFIRKIAKELRL